jgi:hypothetical protein
MQVVLGHRSGCADGDVQTAGVATETPAVAQVVLRIDQQHHVAVLVGPGRGYVELAGAQRQGPVNAAQAVAWLKRPDVGELAAIPRPA